MHTILNLAQGISKMALKYYFDLMSQPSRAVYIFLKANNIKFEAKPVALRKGNYILSM